VQDIIEPENATTSLRVQISRDAQENAQKGLPKPGFGSPKDLAAPCAAQPGFNP